MTSTALFSATDPPPALPRRSLAHLLLGGGLLFMTFMRFSVGELAWVAFAPFLVFLHSQGTLRRHLSLLAALVIAFLATVSKMATSEIPWAPPVPLFAVPIAIAYFLSLATAGAAHRRLGPRWGVYAFASTTVVMGWVQYTFTSGSSWGILAHTQLDNLALVQVAALTGVGGLTFLVALGSALTATVWSCGLRTVRTDVALFGLFLAFGLIYGQLRLTNPAPGELVRIGGVVSPVTHDDFRAAFEDVDRLRKFDDELFARSRRAAELGAQVVVWNEMATVVSASGESALASRAASFARERGVMLVMAYGLVESTHPFRDVNKYRIYLPNGTIADEYIKRHPVPGDPDQVGQSHARIIKFRGVEYTGGICYDYGFPQIALDNANDGGAVALVPSSDWRGIDPEHGRMALMNAVAVGLSMMRPVRAATTIATDQYGRLVGTMRADRGSDGVLVANLPTERVTTLYARTGEIVPVVALAFSVLVLVAMLRSRAAHLLARRDRPLPVVTITGSDIEKS